MNLEWKEIEQEIVKNLNLNKFNKNDAIVTFDKYMKYIQCRVPSATGFSIGFILGWRSRV